MNRGQFFESRKVFVEEGLGTIMKAKQDFSEIRYARSSTTDGEYIRLSDIVGRTAWLDVTARSLEDIFKDICRVVLVGEEKISPPASIITDVIKIREIAPLFR